MERRGDHWTRGGYPLGLSIDTIWEKLCQGVSGISQITRFDAHEYPLRLPGKCMILLLSTISTNATCAAWIASSTLLWQRVRKPSRRGLTITESMADRVGVYIGTAFGGLESLEAVHKTL